jgi:galactitol-specific phosphotransferase system IIB component
MDTSMNGADAIKAPISERNTTEAATDVAVLSEVVMHLSMADIVVTTRVDGSVMVNGELLEQVRK